MTLQELQAKLRQTVADGRVGSPVALRLHLNALLADEDVAGGCVAAMRMAHELFDSPVTRLMVRGDFDQQMTVLVTYASGATLFVSVSGCSGGASTIQLQLIGNHGIANLEPAEWIGKFPAGENTESAHWRRLLAESQASGKAVAITGEAP